MASKFCKRHYEAVAETLRCEVRNDLDEKSFRRVVATFQDMFQRDNGTFRASKFEEACYPKATVKA